jgi:hypothetical protein
LFHDHEEVDKIGESKATIAVRIHELKGALVVQLCEADPHDTPSQAREEWRDFILPNDPEPQNLSFLDVARIASSTFGGVSLQRFLGARFFKFILFFINLLFLLSFKCMSCFRVFQGNRINADESRGWNPQSY